MQKKKKKKKKPSVEKFQSLFEPLAKVSKEEIQHLLNESETLELKAGDFLFEPDQPADRMFFILSGRIEVYGIQQNQKREFAVIQTGSISGLLPYSRMEISRGYAKAIEDTHLLTFHRNKMSDLIKNHYSLTEALVHFMSSRIREFTKYQQQSEKMMALGKLSAGLAHELNNPASAIVRSSKELQSHLKAVPNSFKKVISVKMDPSEVDMVNNLLFKKIDNKEVPKLTLMQRQELEDNLADCLEERGVEDGYEAAENLIDYNFSCDDVEMIYEKTGEVHFPPVIKWINDNLTTEKMVKEIGDASSRIADLVASVKTFTHMDQTPDKVSTDIHEGIENTLIMLNHKVKKNNIVVNRIFGESLPKPKILVSALNQVWTNLIDNAIDAMSEVDSPTLEIETKQDRDFIQTFIRDNGSGIPEEIVSRIFDPFFTTKSIGQGTGLGLDVVKTIINRHRGTIKVNSEPGKTEFEVCIPIES